MSRHTAASPELPTSGRPQSRLAFKGWGVVEFNANGTPHKIWTRYGDAQPNPWLDRPLADATYCVFANTTQHKNGVRLLHRFRTGIQGATERAEAVHVLKFSGKLTKGRRWTSVPVGYPGAPYDRGHLIACEFGAGMEAINLVTMPSSVNQGHHESTTRRKGFNEIADLSARYSDSTHHSGGTLTGSGEYALPNFREFERHVKIQIARGLDGGYEVSMRVVPSTFLSDGQFVTDILYGEIGANGNALYRYKIDCDID
jgi:hypothetical protein